MGIKKCLADNFEVAQKKINKMIKKLNKYDINYKFEILETKLEKIDFVWYEIVFNGRYSEQIKHCESQVCKVQYFIFDFDKIDIGDYEVIAVLEKSIDTEDNKVFINNDKYVLSDLKKYLKSNYCEHCKSKRNRKKTIILNNKLTNELIQVGSTCLKDYTGFYNSDEYLKLIELASDNSIQIYDNECNIGSYSSFPKISHIETKDYLTKCINLIKNNGYVKYKTKNKAFNDEVVTTTEDEEDTKKVMEYFENLITNSDFEYNIKVSLKNEYTMENGFIAYAYVNYCKKMEIKLLETKKAETTKFYGNIKDKVNLEMELYGIHTFETNYTYYGEINYVYKFIDKEGNLFAWKTQKEIEISEGDKAIIKGTIKDHNEFKGEKSTMLTRCKIEVLEAEAEAEAEIEVDNKEVAELKEILKTEYAINKVKKTLEKINNETSDKEYKETCVYNLKYRIADKMDTLDYIDCDDELINKIDELLLETNINILEIAG